MSHLMLHPHSFFFLTCLCRGFSSPCFMSVSALISDLTATLLKKNFQKADPRNNLVSCVRGSQSMRDLEP